MANIKVEFDVPATMRDGVTLRANVFRPDDDGSYPIALTRTPYSKDLTGVSPILDPMRMAQAGYIVVIQDVRGRFHSEGEWKAFRFEAEDGYDSVEWAATLPGSNGNVGMYGASYFGFTQWAAARLQPPHLKALMPFITWADSRDGVLWRGGAYELGTSAAWQLGTIGFDVLLKRYAEAEPMQKYQALVALVKEIDQLRTEGYASLPLKDFGPLTRMGFTGDLADIVNNPNSQEMAASTTIAHDYDKIQVPSYNVGGWYDIFCNGTLQNFAAMRGQGANPTVRQSRLLMGPWSHVNYSNVVGEIDFGFTSQSALINLQTDLTGLTQRWFDFWLKGIENGVNNEPPVKLFVMGDNVWRDEQEWPLARTQYVPYYLHSGGLANTATGNGTLSTQQPTMEPADRYTYDPANPVTTFGGSLLMHPLFGPGARDQRQTEVREDVLVFTTPALTQDTEVTGPLLVKLWASSDALDTDFVARLVDVHPDGFAQPLNDGIIRARYRNGDTPELLEPGQAYEFTLNLWATANVFKAGHRIRLDVTSSNFPRWERNPNTGQPFGMDATTQPAHQTIWHDAAHPSHIVLPIVPR